MRPRVRASRWLVAACLSGCATTALPEGVLLGYDETVSRTRAELLVLNVARARHGRPLHFSTVSGIAATFEVRAEATLGGELVEAAGLDLLAPEVGFSASASPTVSLAPVQGEEFTRRLLSPLEESTFGFFYHQGVDVSLLLRLLAHAVILEEGEHRRVLTPGHGAGGAEAFEALAERLRELDARQRLDVGPLLFEESWPVAGPASAGELADLIDRGWGLASSGGGARLVRRVLGRQAITDYDPATLDNEARVALQRRAQEYPGYFVLLDLAGGGPEAAPIRGWIKLRSLASVLDAVADDVAAVTAEDRHGPLAVVESERPPAEHLFLVPYQGRYYSIPPTAARAFRALYSLFEMAFSDVPVAAPPSLTIAK